MKQNKELTNSKRTKLATLLLCPLLCALLLTACTEQPHLNDVPAAYFDCKEWPSKPAADATDVDAGKYIIRGHSAWRSCSEALAGLKGLKLKLLMED